VGHFGSAGSQVVHPKKHFCYFNILALLA
jgi:hypothetical protein